MPIEGVLGLDTTYSQIQSNIEQVGSKADWIVLNIHSPGVTVMGLEELADFMVGFDKPIASYTSGMMASAAYFIGSATELIGSSKSAMVGSIGTILQTVDMTGMLDSWGVKVHTFASGARKAAGNPYVSMTDDHKEEFTEIVSDAFGVFSGFVESRRGVSRDLMDGRVMFGQAAASSSLTDGVFPNLESFISAIEAG